MQQRVIIPLCFSISKCCVVLQVAYLKVIKTTIIIPFELKKWFLREEKKILY